MFVDHESESRATLRDFLSSEGFQITLGENGSEMRELMKDQQFDLVLLHISLPDEDGLGLLRELRQLSVNTPIIILADKDEEIDEVVGLEIGADDFVAKPLRPRALSARIKTVLRRSKPGVRQNAAGQARNASLYSFVG